MRRRLDHAADSIPVAPLRLPILLLALLPLLVQTASAQYKWIDADGAVGYGDEPPAGARRVEPIHGAGSNAGGGSDLGELPFELRRAVERYPVILYTTGDCPPCDSGRALLRARAVPFEERTVTTREDVETLRRTRQTGQLPLLAVGRELLVGFEAASWQAALDAAAYPRQPAIAPSRLLRTVPRPLVEQQPAGEPAEPRSEPAPPSP